MRPLVIFLLLILLSIAHPIFADSADALKPIGVRQLMGNVELPSGSVCVEGVVSQVFPDHQLLALIDAMEQKECNSLTCAKMVLPVRWKGAMPKSGQPIEAEGAVTEEKGRLIFVATVLRLVEKQK